MVTDAEDAEASDVPPPFVAVTVNEYVSRLVNGLTTHDIAGRVTAHVAPPGDAVTV